MAGGAGLWMGAAGMKVGSPWPRRCGGGLLYLLLAGLAAWGAGGTTSWRGGVSPASAHGWPWSEAARSGAGAGATGAAGLDGASAGAAGAAA